MATYEIAKIGAPRPPRKFLPNISSRHLQPRAPQELPHSLALHRHHLRSCEDLGRW